MFCNLNAEFVRKNIVPHIGVSKVLGCSDRAAKNKLKGLSEFTVMEAWKIKIAHFPNMSIDYLFATDD